MTKVGCTRLFFSFGYGRCRTVARSLHEHTVKTTFVQGPKVHKCRQIKTNQKTHKTHNQDDPQIPQPDLRFVRKNSKPDTPRGKSPNNKTHNKDLPRDTADLPLCHTQKHAKINYPPRHSVKHRNRSTVHSFVGIEKNLYTVTGLRKLPLSASSQRTEIIHPLLVVMSQWSLYQVPPQQGGADGIGVQEDLQTRCKSSIQPSQKTECRTPSFIGENVHT